MSMDVPDLTGVTKGRGMIIAAVDADMEPEVAKQALEQFPSFKDLAGDMVTQYKTIVDKAYEENRISQQAFYDACNSIIQSLQEELRDDHIDSEERDRIENKMIKVASMIGEKDRENKGMILKTLGGVAVFFVAILGGAAALLGSNTHFSNGGNQLADSDEDDDVIDV